MRVVIYARFSTENQNASSIEDQARVCRSKASALGLTVDAVHADAAVSGGIPLRARSGGAALMADHFDVLIVESLSRLSRDTVDGEMEMRRLEHRGVRIIGVSDGYDSEQGDMRKLMRIVAGAMNEKLRHDIGDMTHRGLSGQVERGFHAGSLSYGYRSVIAGHDAKGEPIGHRLEVHEAHADVVREIFLRYSAGESCQRIAADLNARGVAGPRGGTWCVSALYGSPAKGSGILNNELYVGRYVWNRSRWVRNPDTRKRERLIRPESEWKIDDRAELRIIDDGTWHAVRARMSGTRAEGGRAGRGGIPTTLLGGILRCGLCGGAVVKISATSYGCAARRDRGPAVCAGVSAATKRVDEELVGHVRKQLESPAVLAQLEREAALLVADRGTRDGSRRELGHRVRDLEAEARRLADAIATVGISPTLSTRLREVEAEVARVKRAQAAAPVATLSCSIRESVRALMRDLGGALHAELPVARDALRTALGNVTLQNDEDGVFAVFEDTADRLLLRAVGDGMGLVAGARFELATFGL
jgi:DNA invertase Pin-like site-specific DNA recombinase